MRQASEQIGQAVAQAEVFAVGGGVLADQGDFADSGGGQIFGFAHHGFKAPAAECAAKLGDDAERAGVIAALGDLDVGGMAGRGEHARRGVMIEKRGRGGRRGAELAFDGGENLLHFAGTDHGVHFRNLLADLLAIAFHQASGDDQLAGAAEFFVFGHFDDGVDGLALRGFDEAAGVYHEHVGIAGAGREFVAAAGQNAHHDLGIDEVLRAAQTDESHLRHVFI